MGKITKINFIEELEAKIGSKSKFVSSHSLLHKYTQVFIVPLILKNNLSISTVELTTCGLLSDVLTGVSGASNFFIMGMTPYSNEMKIKIGFPRKETSNDGYGVVSQQAAEQLAKCIRDYSGSDIGIAETGLLTSSELKKKRTGKKAGEVYASIVSNNRVVIEKLSVQMNLARYEMRHEIVFRVLQLLESFLG